jgi:hypothetical protein
MGVCKIFLWQSYVTGLNFLPFTGMCLSQFEDRFLRTLLLSLYIFGHTYNSYILHIGKMSGIDFKMNVDDS